MGLPASSISQCTRVDVWTWQNGADSALHTYLDLDEIKARRQNSVPRPTTQAVPALWRATGGEWGQTGTLVVWSNLDRCLWRTSSAIIDNSEFVVGRMYRKWLSEGRVQIRFTAFNLDQPGMFEGMDALPYGKHAKGNVGISVVRAGRELELDQGIVSQYDPRERWWGVEIEFSPALDDLFGVTNNKQSARNFADFIKLDFADLLKGTTFNALQEDYADDPRGPLLTIANTIRNHVFRMRGQIKDQTAGARTLAAAAKSEEFAPEQEATARTKQRQEAGHAGLSDRDEALPQDTKRENTEQTLRDIGLPLEMAHSLAANIVSDNLKYRFVSADLGSAAFFQVKTKGTGSIILALNTQHPVYESLIEVLEESTLGVSPEELRQRLGGARDGLKTLLIAWARYEDELPEGKLRQAAQNTRDDWGRVARDFLTQDD